MTALTTLTVPARAEEDASLRPVPWRRMAWVTWRQHRVALAGVAALLGALAVYLWLAGLQLHHAYAAATACHPASSSACADLISNFNGTNRFLANGYVLQAVPALIGAFVGAPVLARELETGTFRYAWTQGFGRWRWTLAKLVPLAVVVAAAAGAHQRAVLLVLPAVLRRRPDQTVSAPTGVPVLPGLFDLRGSRSPPGRWPPSRSAAWPACSSAGSSPRSPPPWPPTPGSPSRPGCSCASTT